MNIVIMGPPGAGKGTQAQKLEEELGVPHVSTGKMFRKEKKKGTPLGKQVKETIEKGNLMPDDVTNKVLEKRLEKSDVEDGFILDGYPRTMPQAEFLEEVTDIDHVIELVVSDDEVIRRISSRRVCDECGANYNTIFMPPREEGECDRCGGELVQREDSKPEVVKDRLKIYHRKTAPLIEHYKEEGLLVRVNGEQPIQKVFDDIIQEISG